MLRHRKPAPTPALDLGTTPINGTYPVVLLRQIADELRESIEQLDAAIDQVAKERTNGGRHTHH